jgi:YidC/Oxa1 family membrane protein insertase
MDRNQATGLVLIFGILFVYFTFFAPEPSKLPGEQKKEKQKAAAEKVKAKNDTAQISAALAKLGIADSGISLASKPVFLENEDLKIEFSTLGGKITRVELKKYKTFDKKPLLLLTEGRSVQKAELLLDNQKVNIANLPFATASFSKAAKDTQTLKMTCTLPGGKSVQQSYTIGPGGYQVKYALQTSGFTLPEKSSASYFFGLNANQLEKDLAQNRTTSCINYMEVNKGFGNLSETSLSEEKTDIKEPLQWVALKQKFFNIGLISKTGFASAALRQKTDEADTTSVKMMEAGLEIPVSANGFSFDFYFGPNQFKTLKTIAPEYDKNVYLGWPVINLVNRFITVNVFYWLQDVIPSYGVIIIILVLLIKLILFPLSYRSYISMAKMKVLKPELDEIKERTGDDMQKAQAEQMKLYQQVGINPLSGCIPLLLQMPILLAVFNFFPNAIELRQESFLWAPDLSSYDSVATLPFSIPGYGSHVSLFTILMTASTLVLTWYNNQTTTMQGPMQSMSYIMPVVFMFILNSLPSGLSFYYLVSNVVSIVQQQAIKAYVDEGAIRKKLEANKVKNANKKKTGFAARLEEAMRMAQDAQKEKDKEKKGKKGNS